MKTKIIYYLLIIFITTACTNYIAKYDIYPTNPELERKLNGRYNYQFTEDSLTFELDPDAIEMGFSITNNSSKNVYFVWDSVKVLNVNRKISYSKFRPSSSAKDTLTVITSKTIFRDILPVENLLVYESKSEDKIEKLAKASVGDVILVNLPVIIEEKFIVYKLEFVVKGFQVRENR